MTHLFDFIEGVCPMLPKQKIAGSNPVVTNPEKGFAQLSLCNLFLSTQPDDWATVIEG